MEAQISLRRNASSLFRGRFHRQAIPHAAMDFRRRVCLVCPPFDRGNAAKDLEEGVRNAWDEARAFFCALEAGPQEFRARRRRTRGFVRDAGSRLSPKKRFFMLRIDWRVHSLWVLAISVLGIS